MEQGLLKIRDFYHLPESHYYGLETVVMTLAFMALARIKNPELGGYTFREVRHLAKDGHQTAIIATHFYLGKAIIAGAAGARKTSSVTLYRITILIR
ncbi:MAG: hypothetical protein BRD49_00275 [Bacteroidetes bacterium SW_10_40_5]|nr:MAG: hypothetical protein BRD49_00275 [Bacteroidetes bacterium SW_10_40_5]